MSGNVEHQIIVRSTTGMQLSEGYIRLDERQVSGRLPAVSPCTGSSVKEVCRLLEQEARDYYGHDVYVQVMPGHSMEV